MSDKRAVVARQLDDSDSAIADNLGSEEDLSHIRPSRTERFDFLEAVLQGTEHNIAETRIEAMKDLRKEPGGTSRVVNLRPTAGRESERIVLEFEFPERNSLAGHARSTMVPTVLRLPIGTHPE